MQKANYGTPPSDYEARITGFMQQRLKDPESARYQFGHPQKGWCKDGLIYGGKSHFGWIIPVRVNAKNSFGGYTGFQSYFFLFTPEDQLYHDVTNLWGQMAGFSP
jgi:hypothetical protein